MSTPAEKLNQIEQLITSGFKQDAALLLRQILQHEPQNWQAWELLSQTTTGPAQALCQQKAAEFRPVRQAEPIPDQLSNKDEVDATVPYVPKRKDPPSQPVRVKSPQQKTKQTRVVAPVQPAVQSRYSWRYWGTVGVSGVLLGCLIIFLLNFVPGFIPTPDAIGATEDKPEAELVAAVFEVASPTAAEVVEQVEEQAEPEPLPPTNTPEAGQAVALAKTIGENGQPRDAWTPTPTPTPTNTPTPTIEPTRLTESATSFVMPAVGSKERWVDVNLTLQTLTAYEGKSPVFQTIISSGRPPYYTVTGQFRVYYRLEEQTMDGRRLGFSYVTPGVPHVQYFYGDFAIHGAYWHDDFGTPVSHGCVNVTPADAEWLYNWMSYGTLVNVHY